MAFLRQEYMKFFKVDWVINTTVITDRYQAVASSDQITHNIMATESYVPNSVTLIWTTFSPNDANLLGYAYFPQDMDFVNSPELFFCIMDIPSALTPIGTTVLHEVGHMFGKHKSYIKLFLALFLIFTRSRFVPSVQWRMRQLLRKYRINRERHCWRFLQRYYARSAEFYMRQLQRQQ